MILDFLELLMIKLMNSLRVSLKVIMRKKKIKMALKYQNNKKQHKRTNLLEDQKEVEEDLLEWVLLHNIFKVNKISNIK